MKEALDNKLRDEQAGFRQERSCTDQIATLRMIIEQSIEWNSSLYMNFVDFKRAFDSVDRGATWNILRHYGLPDKFLSIIMKLHENFQCQVIHKGQTSEPFAVDSGVRQGCLLSLVIFLVTLDWVTRTAYGGQQTGIRWTFDKRLDDLEYADDICLLAHRLEDLTDKTSALAETAQRVGLYINTEKTKVMRVNAKRQDQVSVFDTRLENVSIFTYLGSRMSTSGGTEEDIKSRINKARHTFTMLKKIWRSRTYTLKTKIRIFNSNVKSVLLYGSETWRLTNALLNRLQVFINRCLRQILRIRWEERITNVEIWRMASQDPVEIQIKRRKWRWVGHTLRKPEGNITRQALRWNPQGKRRPGRPTRSWRRSSTDELRSLGLEWGQLGTRAQNKIR